MSFTEISKNPKEAGRLARLEGRSLMSNPFRNTNGYAEHYKLWEDGFAEAILEMQKKRNKPDLIG